MRKCKHTLLKKLYMREQAKDKTYQDWVSVKGKVICSRCKQIFDVKKAE